MAVRRNQARNVVLCGFHASGKTSVGWELAKQMRRQFVDVPQELERRARSAYMRMPPWSRQPEPDEIEPRLVIDLAKRRDLVVALGAESLDDPEVREETLEFSFVVFLDPPLEALHRRLLLMPELREQLRDPAAWDALQQQLDSLRSAYEQGDLQITEDLPPAQLARLILHCFYT